MPSVVTTASYQLTNNINGSIMWCAGLRSRMKSSLQYEFKGVNVAVACQLSPVNTYISFEAEKKFENYDLTLQSSIKYGYLGVVFNYGIKKKITEFSHLTGTILIGSKFGVILNIR